MAMGEVKSIEKSQSTREPSAARLASAAQSVHADTQNPVPLNPQLAGNQAMQNLFRPGAGQPRLGATQPDDTDQQETQATRLAAAALRPGIGALPHEALETGLPMQSRRPGGSTLGTLQRPLETISGISLASIRVHHAPQLSQALNARAFAYGPDIFADSGVSNLVLAHEAVHAGLQMRTGQARVQRWADPTREVLNPAEIETWSDAEVTEGISMLATCLPRTSNRLS
jgi:hypothetical protein